MQKQTAIDHFGSASKLADALGITDSAVSLWGNVIPEGSAYKLQVITGGALQVDQSMYKNRPKRGQTLSSTAA